MKEHRQNSRNGKQLKCRARFRTLAASLLVGGTLLVVCRAQSAAGHQLFNHEESKVLPYTEPNPLVSDAGKPVRSAAAWSSVRRPEILKMLRQEMFGFAPSHKVHFVVTRSSVDENALGGLAVRKQITLAVAGHSSAPCIHLLIYLPPHAAHRVPIFLGLNYGGNQSVSKDPGIALGTVWVASPANRLKLLPQCATENMRGSAAAEWPIESILAHGYGFATLYDGDLEPDFDGGESYGFRALPELSEAGIQPAERWGALAVWAWGLSRALDYLGTDPGIDPARVAVIGHSRLGKSALWAGAQDQRFAMVISNESGKGGAALMKRNFGETVEHLNSRFPYWFCGNFKRYSNATQDLPFDSQFLLSLVAPRPLYVASAAGDFTLDAKGEFFAAVGAGPVYRLFGKEDLGTMDMPPVDRPIFHQVGYHIRPGKHEMTSYDWDQYLKFANLHFRHQAQH